MFDAFLSGMSAGLWLQHSMEGQWIAAIMNLAWAFFMAWTSDQSLHR